MNRRLMYRLAVSIVLLTIPALVRAGSTNGTQPFDRISVRGRPVSVSSDLSYRAHVLVFLGTECPMARLYVPRLTGLAEEYADAGLQVVGIYSNRQDGFRDVQECVADLQPGFPVIHDRDNVLADQYKATRTPEVFLLDSTLTVRYHGRIDDQFRPGIRKSDVEREDLRVAVQQLLNGEPIAVPETEFQGCLIGRVRKSSSPSLVENDITYAEHVVPVLRKHCVECHRSGEIAPFAMEEFAEVAGWADTMLETIEDGRMPPWHANSRHGDFLNQRYMPESDRQILRDWVAGGRKSGNLDSIPPLPVVKTDWQLPAEPDLIVPMRDRPFEVPADGVVEYQYFVVDPGFKEDKWVSAAQVVPGDRSVVHHAIVFIRPPDGHRMQGVGWLSAYVPGQRLVQLPAGSARHVPAGSKFVFQMHYTPNGEAAHDISKVALTFADPKDVRQKVITLIAINQDFQIPPRTADYTVEATVNRLPQQGSLLAVAPHMHYRGKSFRLLASDDDSEVLLDVPRYDFNWQHSYAFAKPVPLKELSTLRIRATFDNTEQNPFNPNPDEWVTWGDQSWEEMAVAFFEVALPRNQSGKPPLRRPTSVPANAQSDRRRQQIDAYVARALQSMDVDGDGIVYKSEVPIVVRQFSFRQLDQDDDGKITPAELRKTAEQIYRRSN